MTDEEAQSAFFSSSLSAIHPRLRRDLADLETVVVRQHRRLNVELVRGLLSEFAAIKGDPELGTPFEAALRRAEEAAG